MRISRRYTVAIIVTALVVALFVLKNNPNLFMTKKYLVNSYYYHEIAPADSLRIKIYGQKVQDGKNTPAVVLFHGGGWKNGHIGQLYRHAEYFSQRGLSAILVEYRTEESHGTSPFQALKDARSAMRFIKANARQLKIDSSKLIAMGTSVGGHLALGTALLDSYNNETDPLGIDPSPDAIVLLSGIIDTGSKGYGSKEVKEAFRDFSPIHNIATNGPPLLMFFGENDQFTPPNLATSFCTLWQQNNDACTLEIVSAQGHEFSHPNRSKEQFEAMMLRVMKFLESNGFITQ